MYRYLLVPLRAAWIALVVLSLVVFVSSIPVFVDRYLAAASETTGAGLDQIGPSPHFRVGYLVAFDGLTVLVLAFTAAMIFWRRSDDFMALLVSASLLTLGVAISPTLQTLMEAQPVWALPAQIVQYFGYGLLLFVLYLFPDGRFVPRWTGVVAIIWTAWGMAWTFFPLKTIDPEAMPFLLRWLIFLFVSSTDILKQAPFYLRLVSFLLMTLGWFGSGVFAQIYRYQRVSTPAQRQQTKWIVVGLTASLVGYFGYQLLPILFPSFDQPGLPQVLYQMIGKPISTILLILAPIAIMASMLRYRLWDIDPIIHRTLVYGALTGALIALYIASVFVLQRIFQAITGQESDLAIIVSTLAIAALSQPLRNRLQGFIDRAFYRERVDFRRAFTNFSREIRTIIELPELLRVLTARTTEMLHIAHGAVFLIALDGTFERTETHDLPPGQGEHLTPAASQLGRLREGHPVAQPKDSTYPLLVPLIAPRTEGHELVGVLALGPRLSGQTYSREDQALLIGLANQAGTAIYVARLIEEMQAEAQRRQEAERRLEAYRNSPVGRAEAFAQELLAKPHAALVALRHLAQQAGQDPEAASLINNLPRALESLDARRLASLAEGFTYLLTGQFEPEMLHVALRTLITQLETCPTDDDLHHAAEALTIYRLCQDALNVSTITEITQLLASFEPLEQQQELQLFHELNRVLAEMHGVAEALHAYERVDTSQDKLAYLASAIERLRRTDYLARTELGGADQPIIHQIVENWLTVVTGAMRDLQTRAHIVCQLLTRHTWQSDVVPLVLSLRNEGRGAALNLKVTLAPAPEYTLLDEVAHAERLAPGEEVRVELRVRPRLTGGADQFRARFVIMYTDPRGPDQVEHFADVVRLLVPEGEFQYIPNPYVVGTPLEAGSPLFFGRADVVAFIQENLTAMHRNNLVLIGQRRTGKTSLLKQLPVRLGDDYLPVYLDGQALGLDPGLPNFFLSLATEISFALEDRAFEIEPPTYEDFTASPTVAFEREFLPRVRQAIGRRHLLIMFDEFEELETAVQRGNLDPAIFGFLRHLVQHAENLSVIFCGTHRLEELASDYWSVLFNISLYRHIAFLEKPEAMRLIQEPVASYGMRYDDLALDKMWQVTAGHPYFLQLLCHSLVNRHNRTERNYVTIADVNAALDEILASGEAHFVYLWAEAAAEQRLVLAALSRLMPLTSQATAVQVTDYLAERGVGMERQAVGDALHRLALRDILAADNEADPAGGTVYRWKLGLLGLWVERYKSLNRVIEEMRR